MAAISELRVTLFSCCIPQQPKRKHHIDRSMIGYPTNFQHTGHVGSRDVEMPGEQLIALQNQMKSKGGYETPYKIGLLRSMQRVLLELPSILSPLTGGLWKGHTLFIFLSYLDGLYMVNVVWQDLLDFPLLKPRYLEVLTSFEALLGVY